MSIVNSRFAIAILRISEKDIVTFLCNKDSINTKRVMYKCLLEFFRCIARKGQPTDFVSLSTSVQNSLSIYSTVAL